MLNKRTVLWKTNLYNKPQMERRKLTEHYTNAMIMCEIRELRAEMNLRIGLLAERVAVQCLEGKKS